jgi:hypothetical protein
MHVFFDTEFTELSLADSKLISIGFVSQLGLEFYAELADGWSTEDCSKFVMAEVLPHLDGAASTWMAPPAPCHGLILGAD